MVPADSDRISRVPPYSGLLLELYLIRVRDFHPLRPAFPNHSTFVLLLYRSPTTPACRNKIGLGCSHFARHYSGNHYCFLFLWVMRCFSSPGLLPVYTGYPPYDRMGCPIRISTDQRLFAPPRSLSQLITSFFASESQGILRTPLVTFFFESLFHILS